MRHIEIESLSEAELVELNHRIVERIRFLREVRAHERMAEFVIGDRVAFQPDGVTWIEGTLTRYNRKTVTVHTDAGRRWNVSPGFLRKLAPVVDVPTNHPASNVVPLKR